MTSNEKLSTASYIIAFTALIGVVVLGLLPAFISGFVVYSVVEFGSRKLGKGRFISSTGKILLLALIAAVVITGLSWAVVGIFSQMTSGPEGISVLFQKMADVVGRGGSYIPAYALAYIPANINEWETAASGWLLKNASDFSKVGIGFGRFIIHVIIGMVIGGMIALTPHRAMNQIGLAHALQERLTLLGRAFRRIVFSQIRISAVNTLLTAIFLLGVLPLLGVHLPMQKTMVAVTFIAGLLPVIGNLISNTIIFLIGLSVSTMAGVMALLYLIFIHKLEYFLNARIIGGQIRARAWEILMAMLVMESAFGLGGVVAAPIYYAWLKDELSSKKLI